MITRIEDTARIIRFMDGDTVMVDLRCASCGTTSQKRVRLAGIESWEPSGTTRSLAMGAAYMLNEQYADKVGVFVYSSSRCDRYGRMIGDILLEGILLTSRIVAQQLAWMGVGSPQPSHIDPVAVIKRKEYGNS